MIVNTLKPFKIKGFRNMSLDFVYKITMFVIFLSTFLA